MFLKEVTCTGELIPQSLNTLTAFEYRYKCVSEKLYKPEAAMQYQKQTGNVVMPSVPGGNAWTTWGWTKIPVSVGSMIIRLQKNFQANNRAEYLVQVVPGRAIPHEDWRFHSLCTVGPARGGSDFSLHQLGMGNEVPTTVEYLKRVCAGMRHGIIFTLNRCLVIHYFHIK